MFRTIRTGPGLPYWPRRWRFKRPRLLSVELGTLKGSQGDQNYDLPAAADLKQYQAVVIYCKGFHAIFGVAKLEEF